MTEPCEKTTVQKTIDIRAPRDVIWNALTGPETFRDWCSAFCPTSRYEGDWSEGSTMRFLGDDEKGNVGGMLSKIVEHVPGHTLRAKHFGVIENGQDVTSGPAVEYWGDAIEEYRLSGGPETFTLEVVSETAIEMAEWFSGAWDKALARLKEIAEESAHG